MKVEKFTQILEEGNTAEDLIKALRFNKMIIDNTERLNDTDGAIVYALMARYLKAKSSTEEEGNSPCLEKYELQEAVKRTTGKPISERDIRKRCRALLAQGFPILSSSSHRGFYVSDNIEEIERCRLQNYNRAMELLKINAGYNKVIEIVKGQKSIDEICPKEEIVSGMYAQESKEKRDEYDDIIEAYTPNASLRKEIREFIKMRQILNKPLTGHALELILDKLTALAPFRDDEQILILQQSIEHSWDRVFKLEKDR